MGQYTVIRHRPVVVCFQQTFIKKALSIMYDINENKSIPIDLAIRAFDVLTLIIAGEVASAIHFHSYLEQTSTIHSILLYLCSFLAFLGFEKAGIYRSWRGILPSKMLLNIAMAWGVVLLIGLFFSFLIHRSNEVSRLWLFYWFIVGASLVIAMRILLHTILRHFRKKGFNRKRVVIVGYGAIGQEMHMRAEAQNWFGYEVVAVYAEEKDREILSSTTVIKLTSLDDLPSFVESNHINEIWIALSIDASIQPQKLQYLLRSVLVDIRWVPDMLSIRMLSNDMVDFLGFPTIDLNRPILSGFNGILKELFDRMFALTVLILLSPLLIGIAIGIKRDSPGSIFFKQYRHGLNGKLFSVYKFRTMKPHVASAELIQAKKDDDRITPFGKFMRRTSLDELPQFINVLFGDMSIVGPRPHALQHNNFYKNQIDLYMLRHRVKPGITGWAQIHGLRGETDTLAKMAERVQFDLYYIRHWSFWMDIRIIVWTAFKGWTGSNAY